MWPRSLICHPCEVTNMTAFHFTLISDPMCHSSEKESKRPNTQTNVWTLLCPDMTNQVGTIREI